MASFKFDISAYQKKLSKLGLKAEGICKAAVYNAAGMVVEEIKRSTPVDTGALRDSVGLKPFENENGYVYTQVSFNGYDAKGTPNALKARVLESGTSKRKKKPFIDPAMKRIKGAAQTQIEKDLDEILKKTMEG